MTRYFLQISYRGTSYNGWQIQDKGLGVQQVLNEKLSLQLGEPVYVVGCGRTDTGVHARKYFLHFDLNKALVPDDIRKLNIFLPRDIAIQKIFTAAPESHARWNALCRTYTYLITRKKNPFLEDFASYIYSDINIEAMQSAAAILPDYHDFESLCKINIQNKHHLCDVFEARWLSRGDLLIFTISANRFLRGMVRILVGTMLEIGKGRMTLQEFKELIENKNRINAGAAAPAQGLYLSDVGYPDGMLTELK